LGLGRILAQLMVKGVTDSMSAQMLNRVSVTHLEFTYQHQLQGILVGTLTAFVASLWPSWRATWIKPVEAMKNRDELGDAKSRLNQKTPLLGVLMMGLMLLLTLTGLTQKNIWVEHFSQFCAVVGSALLGPWIVTSFLKLIRPLLVRHGSTVARLSHDNILRNPRRTAGNIMSLMVGLLLVMLIACVQASFKDTIFQWFDKILKADILVSSNGRVISYEMQPVHEELWKKIETIEGVMPSPEGSYQAMRMVHLQYEGQQISLKAYDEPPLELKYSNFDVKDRSTEKAGYDLFHSTEPTVLVSENFEMHYGLKTGDTLNLATPSGSQKFKIVGVMTDFASPRGVLYMDRKYFREYWKDPLVSFFAVSIKKGYALENIRREIESRLGQENNLIAISNRDLREQLMGSIEHSFAYTRAVESAALLVALLGLLNTLLISVMERTREIGMCRAIGMSRSQVSSMIMRESLLQGGLGALVATLLGSLLAWVWINYSLSHVLGWIVHFSFPWMSILTTVLIGVCVAWLAGIYPSRRAARLEIREALDVE
jgi:putative ABC transport system permease protein